MTECYRCKRTSRTGAHGFRALDPKRTPGRRFACQGCLDRMATQEMSSEDGDALAWLKPRRGRRTPGQLEEQA